MTDTELNMKLHTLLGNDISGITPDRYHFLHLPD